MIHNPILPGFHPDPSIIRVEDDFYLVTSTFEWFPGIPLYHSKDLKHWQLVDHLLKTPKQADLLGVEQSRGVWAPGLSYDEQEGRFYLTYSVVHSRNNWLFDVDNYLMWTDDIRGEWSDPVYVNSSGFDPFIFHDDDGSKWIWYSRNISGRSPIELLKHLGFHNGDYISIIKDLARYAEGKGYVIINSFSEYEREAEKEKRLAERHAEFELPEKNKNAKRMFAYLIKERGIDPAIVYDLYFNKKLIYESALYHNIVFKGQADENGKVLYAGLRSPFNGEHAFKGDALNSDKTYAFVIEGKSDFLIVGEAPIDILSHATLTKMSGKDWEEDHRLSLCGLDDACLSRYLSLHPEIKKIKFCLDNDINGKNYKGEPENHGQLKAMELMQKYAEKGYEIHNYVPIHKDLNEDLKYIKELMEDKKKQKNIIPREKTLMDLIVEAQKKNLNSIPKKANSEKELVH